MGTATHKSLGPVALATRWVPALVALGLFAQICLLGLRPALAESRRLDAAEQRMHARLDTAMEHQGALERTLRAQQDPIYLERERKHLLGPGRPDRPDRAGGPGLDG